MSFIDNKNIYLIFCFNFMKTFKVDCKFGNKKGITKKKKFRFNE